MPGGQLGFNCLKTEQLDSDREKTLVKFFSQSAHIVIPNILSTPTEQFKTFKLMLVIQSNQPTTETEQSFLILFTQRQ